MLLNISQDDKKILHKIKTERPNLMPLSIWSTYTTVDNVKSIELTALIGRIRSTCGLDCELTILEDTGCRNFQNWIMTYHNGGTKKIDGEQMDWLHMIRGHIASSFHIENDDFNLTRFDARGCLRKLHKIFGSKMPSIINELNEALVA